MVHAHARPRVLPPSGMINVEKHKPCLEWQPLPCLCWGVRGGRLHELPIVFQRPHLPPAPSSQDQNPGFISGGRIAHERCGQPLILEGQSRKCETSWVVSSVVHWPASRRIVHPRGVGLWYLGSRHLEPVRRTRSTQNVIDNHRPRLPGPAAIPKACSPPHH